ncbi:hypothetical protein VPNG_02257 [Cytospora leucostoma]|uniref:Uncharacterized protein n=1 Tax=Cytospora leucostoma TaxID=1230097 RepID=A0A423XGT2_9PEZI|nr:hypothetical protein VPNG_02257 [Cytospora leucostoma]
MALRQFLQDESTNNKTNNHNSTSHEPPPPPPSTSSSSSSLPSYRYLGVLHIAAQKGHDRIIHTLLNHHPHSSSLDCDAPDSEGRTPLMHAVVAGHPAVVQALLAAGARCDPVDRARRSVLHLAVLYGREEVLRLLLVAVRGGGCGSLLDAYDADGDTPLHLAVAEGFEAGVVMLLRSGTDLEVQARRC